MYKPSMPSRTKLVIDFCLPINDSRLNKFRDAGGNIKAPGYIIIKSDQKYFVGLKRVPA